MIRNCNVKMHNEKVSVIIFEGNEIQVPSSSLIGKTAYVRYEKNKYEVVSKSEYEKEVSDNARRKNTKNSTDTKETKDLSSDNIAIDNEE